MGNNKILSLACLGCGSRGQMYTRIASEMKDQFYLTAAADPVKERVEKIKRFSGNPSFRSYSSADEFFAQGKLADLLIIATQDAQHYCNCMKAIELGYEILLEKPAATELKQIFELQKYAALHNSRIMLCFVLRFSPFYLKVKDLISSGTIGEIVNMNFVSGISPWRMAHSFVRGHWSVTENSTPIIVAKACHDTDIISWLTGNKCISLSSFGSLTHFVPSNAPDKAPDRCTGECPVGETCIYNAVRYTTDKKNPWLPQIYDCSEKATDEEILRWLSSSGWGRCVYKCGNNAPDNQVVSMQFENNITCTFTMTAFETGRSLEIFGTKGVLRGGENSKKLFNSEIVVIPHDGKPEVFNVTDTLPPAELRILRDKRLIENFYTAMSCGQYESIDSSIAETIEGHLIAFAAEESRINGRVVCLNKYRESFK